MASGSGSLIWFRKGLRIHDNPALELASQGASHLYPVFVIDPHYMEPDPNAFSPGSSRAGLNRIKFLLDSLVDLNLNLQKLGSRLLILKGDPAQVLIRCLKEWNVRKLCFEFDTEPYYQALDIKVKNFALAAGIEVCSPVSHTLFNPMDIIEKNGGKPPLSYQSFVKLAGQPPSPLSTKHSSLPPVGHLGNCDVSEVPTINDLGYEDAKQVPLLYLSYISSCAHNERSCIQDEFSPFKGGESEALKRLAEYMKDKVWVANFEKPKGNPSAFLRPATTILSPYLKFGCLSSRYFYQHIQDVYKTMPKHTSPPVSLLGQLLWRDFFYTAAFGTPNFDRMKGNRICKQIPWKDDNKLLEAWREARTGFPWIDAIMVQLRQWGWMHHLARHSVACFLTRGDLFVHWEKGRDVFERLLIDSDWAINNGNWLWLSCSSFFYQYHRIYSPITFGKKYDPNGDYIRHFLPVLKDMPKEYIYEPWTAPISIQTKANCIIGKDYPMPGLRHVPSQSPHTLYSRRRHLFQNEERVTPENNSISDLCVLFSPKNDAVTIKAGRDLRSNTNMWRRLLSSHLKTLTSLSSPRSAPAAARFPRAAAPPAVSLLPRHFSTPSDDKTAIKKKVEDVMPIATGHEREEIQAELEGRDILEIDHPVGPFGTKEEPAVVKSYYDKRIVGCPGGEGEDEHDVVWFWLEKGKPHECPVCSQYFVLEVVGPGGPPPGHGDDDHH